MYFLYADESGDSGLINSPTRYYVLAGIVVHELVWRSWLDRLLEMRRLFKNNYGLKIKEEIHAAPYITKPGKLSRIPKHERLAILRGVLDTIASQPDISVYGVVVDKSRIQDSAYDVFEWAWKVFLQRFENTLSHRNFAGPQNPQDMGLVITDKTNEIKLRQILRKMRRFNPIPSAYPHYGSRNIQVLSITEDPIMRESVHSFFVQAADVIAYMLYQKFQSNSYIRKKGAQNYFFRLDPVLCKAVSSLQTGYVLL